MIVITSYRDGRQDAHIEWTFGQEKPFHPMRVHSGYGRMQLVANGRELEYIRTTFSNVPDNPSMTQICWHGDDAIFIINNLPAYHGNAANDKRIASSRADRMLRTSNYELTKQEFAIGMTAIGQTLQITNLTPGELLTDLTKFNMQTFKRFALQNGLAEDRVEDVMHVCSGNLFGLWP